MMPVRNLRDLLLKKARAEDKIIKHVVAYINTQYLRGGELDDKSSNNAKMLISDKAKRIHLVTSNQDMDVNWFRAKLYTSMYYENISAAIQDGDKEATRNVLKAFEFSKAPENRYEIINSFEAAVAINCLDKDILRSIVADTNLYNFSMVQVSEWSSNISPPKQCCGRFRYDRDDRQIIYDGVMGGEELDVLIKHYPGTACERALNRLFEQSRLTPYQKMIL